MKVLRSVLYWTLYAFALPGFVISQVILWLLWAMRLGTRPFHESRGVFWSHKRPEAVLKFRDVIRKIPLLGRLVKRQRPWGGHAMLGPGVWASPTFSERGRQHELKHVWQLYDCYFATGALALILLGLGTWTRLDFGWGAALILWCSGALVWLASYPASGMRGERFYADAMVEQAAYAITNRIEPEHVGHSWEDILHKVKRW